MNLSNIFNCKSDKIRKLEEENKILKDKLSERQEVINKTNAYWKKRLASATNSKKQGNSRSSNIS
jgi:hypothetical protein